LGSSGRLRVSECQDWEAAAWLRPAVGCKGGCRGVMCAGPPPFHHPATFLFQSPVSPSTIPCTSSHHPCCRHLQAVTTTPPVIAPAVHLPSLHSSSSSPPYHPPRSPPRRRSILVDDLDMKRGHWDGISSEAKDFVATLLNKVGGREVCALHAVYWLWRCLLRLMLWCRWVLCCGAVPCWVAALLRPSVL
jgi:hypothetical protein